MPVPPEPSPARSQHSVDVEHLYRQYQRQLQRAVAHVVTASPELIEDACQFAWTMLLSARSEPCDVFAWLRLVAIRQAYLLSRVERRALHLEALDTADGWDQVIPDTVSLDDTIEARWALRVLAELPQRQRQDLSLHVAGFSYREIAEMTGGRTFTNVNKHLVKARARVRLARLQRSELRG